VRERHAPTDAPGPTPLSYHLDAAPPDALVLVVAGEVDLLTVPAFAAGLDELVGATEPVLVINLTDVAFLGSRGLAELVAVARRAEHTTRRLRLITAAGPVLRLLDLTGVGTLFDVFPDRDSALGR
jgi:anti-anti-sigma factor